MLKFDEIIPAIETAPAPTRQPQTNGQVNYANSGNGLLDWARNEILAAPDGAKHNTLVKVAYTLGGHVAAGALAESAAFDACFSAITSRSIHSETGARKTIEDGLREGSKKPLEPGHKGYAQMPVHRPAPAMQNQPVPEQSPDEHFNDLQQYRFDSEKPIQKPQALISIEQHIISTRGNVTTIAGQAKGGKTGVTNTFILGALALPGDVQPDLLGFTIEKNSSNKALLHIDGEQSRYDHYKGMSRLLKRASRNKEPEWFYSYNFRTLDISDRLKALRLLAERLAARHSGIHMIVLDGGADFVLDTNDLKESNEVVRFFEALAIEFDCSVIIVLHFNPGSEKGRGHFGSQLERKSESVISVSKDKESEVSTIEGKFLRNSGNIPNLQFIYDEEKGHHVYHGIRNKAKTSEARINKLKEIAEAIFSENPPLTHTELYKKIMPLASIEKRAAINYINEMVENEIIQKSDGNYKISAAVQT